MELPANVKIHDAAFVEADDAYEWYANVDPRIANRFQEELRAAAIRIGEHPERYPLYPESSRVRWIKLRKFPYLLIYEISVIPFTSLPSRTVARDLITGGDA